MHVKTKNIFLFNHLQVLKLYFSPYVVGTNKDLETPKNFQLMKTKAVEELSE